MADIVSIDKRNQFVIFELSDGTNVQYDLERQITIGKKGAPTKGLATQLKGIALEDVKPLFKDQGFYEFLRRVCYAGSHTCYTLNGALMRAPSFSCLEGYVRLGIKVSSSIRTPVSELPRSMLKWLTDNECSYDLYNGDSIRVWRSEEPTLQAFLSQRTPTNAFVMDQLIAVFLDERRYNRCSGRFYDLIETYRYNPATLIRYLCDCCIYEGIDYYSVTMLLRDYAMMQTYLTGGQHNYEKYPRHLLSMHKIAQRNYNRMSRDFDEEAFKRTHDPYLDTTIGRHIFICPTSSSMIKDEAVQQQHCVAAYIDRVLDGKCHIVFMRDKHAPDEALVTLEIVNGRVVQAKGHHDRDVTSEEEIAIRAYQNHLNKRKVAAA